MASWIKVDIRRHFVLLSEACWGLFTGLAEPCCWSVTSTNTINKNPPPHFCSVCSASGFKSPRRRANLSSIRVNLSRNLTSLVLESLTSLGEWLRRCRIRGRICPDIWRFNANSWLLRLESTSSSSARKTWWPLSDSGGVAECRLVHQKCEVSQG